MVAVFFFYSVANPPPFFAFHARAVSVLGTVLGGMNGVSGHNWVMKYGPRNRSCICCCSERSFNVVMIRFRYLIFMWNILRFRGGFVCELFSRIGNGCGVDLYSKAGFHETFVKMYVKINSRIIGNIFCLNKSLLYLN